MDSLKLIKASSFSPVTLPEAKQQCNVDIDEDDDLLNRLISAAVDKVEIQTKRALATQTWEWRLDRFPKWFDVPMPPLQSVTSITYIDTDGNEQTLDSSLYTVDNYSVPARITPAYNESWPDTRGHINDVTVTFVAGYESPTKIPEAIKQAILLLVADMYENREDSLSGRTIMNIPLSASSLLGPFQVVTL